MSSGEYASTPQLAADPNEPIALQDASSILQVKAILKRLAVRKALVTDELDRTLAARSSISRQLSRLDLSRARLGTLSNAARALSNNQLNDAAYTASRISAAVSRLDLEQERVKATLAAVEQVSELRACVLGVVGSMGAPQDWETAAEYISRASRIPSDVAESGFAEEVVPTAEVPDPPSQTLDDAAKSLCRLFLREFESAVEVSDGAKITRFFKMFPLIGRSQQGLDAYGRYVCHGVATRARTRLQGLTAAKDGQPYVAALTKLFEHIAQVVDGHSNLVQRHYGFGTMVKVIERLHAEADVQGGIILDTWNDERAIDRKLTDVRSYAYSFLVQSFLPLSRGTSTPRSGSPMTRGGRRAGQDDVDDAIDMKEVDQVLGEITTMLGHWSLYLRFTSSRAAESHLSETMTDQEISLTIPNFIADSRLPQRVSKILIESFNHFATFFLRRSVERAFQLEEVPSGLSLNTNKHIKANAPYISSAVDDVMYMVNQIIQRSLASSQAFLVLSITSTVGRVLGSDFIGMIQRKMRDESYPKAAIQGSMPPENKVIAFLVLMNNLDVATDYIKRIVSSSTTDPDETNDHREQRLSRPVVELFPMNNDSTTVRTSLLNLQTSFCGKASDLIQDGLTVAFSQVVKPRMRPFIAETFREVDYSTAEEIQPHHTQDMDSADELDHLRTVKERLQSGWDALLLPMKRILTERNAERLTAATIVYLSNILEKRIWAYHGRVSELGAVQLERDVADVTNVTMKGESFRLRESFNRCLEIVAIMNMEIEEWEEITSPANVTGGDESMWVLNSSERQRARTMVRR